MKVSTIMREIFIAGGVAAVVVIFAGGCGGSKVREVNVGSGEYYSEDDYDLLSDGEKNAYCTNLTTELGHTKSTLDNTEQELEDTRFAIEAIRQQIIPIDRQTLNLEADIRTLKGQIEEIKALPRTYRVRPDDSLSLIASFDDIYNNLENWWKIFEANQDKIDDPYYIFPDTVLVIPRDWPIE
ncbi:MAG: LysM peptidoglycan-binding domain-containing protein [bacterium]|nr:LysM peptidoglycan-binding domain-containing protein [bacterium]